MMKRMIQIQQTFRTSEVFCHATDVTFQHVYRPSGMIGEGKGIPVGSINCMDMRWKYYFSK